MSVDLFRHDDFGLWLEGRSPATRRAYCSDVRQLEAWLGEVGVADPAMVSRLHLRSWMASMTDRGLAKATIGAGESFTVEVDVTNTGQRQGDLLRLPWSSFDGSAVRLRQSKGGVRVTVPAGVLLMASRARSAGR